MNGDPDQHEFDLIDDDDVPAAPAPPPPPGARSELVNVLGETPDYLVVRGVCGTGAQDTYRIAKANIVTRGPPIDNRRGEALGPGYIKDIFERITYHAGTPKRRREGNPRRRYR